MKWALLFTLCFSVQAHALPKDVKFAGWDKGNAGDVIASEFLFTGRDLLQRLEIAAQDGDQIFPTEEFRKVLENVVVTSEDHVFVDGLERDIKTEPSKNLITVSRSRWPHLRQSSETKGRLKIVFHEIHWFFGDSDKNFAISEAVVEKLNVPPYNPSIWLNAPGTAFATAECTGKMEGGGFLTVIVNTKGATRAPDRGEVKIERDGNTFGYHFGAEEIAQFFELDDEVGNFATVGLNAYVNREFPVFLKYDGKNYVDLDLKVVLDTDESLERTNNFLRVWKGPGFDAKDQYVVADPICSVWSNN